ncbi:MAG: elongation factor G [Chloroherpetonaceae bacterium]|nr:elongation factor G [Chloroherpetonaceae bacterium]MCS7211822.1 elongation factor G [Chloroherpetonaceae bacterium]MDW8020259.1 elongation factor G [Chloroherpetonaceae bacterium]
MIYQPQFIRNVAVAGHAGSGKTMLTEAIAYTLGLIKRMGAIEHGNTVSDHAPDEIARQHSVNSSLITGTWQNGDGNIYKINFIDTPGFTDFHGDVKCAIRAADTVLIAVNACTGVEVGTELVWEYAKEFYKPTAFVITKLDNDRADYEGVLEQLRERFGHQVAPVQFPAEEGLGHHLLVDVLRMKEYEFTPDKLGAVVEHAIEEPYRKRASLHHQELVESVAESDDGLMERFFEEGGELTEVELRDGIKHALVTRTLFPVFCTSPVHLIGVERLLDAFVYLFPSPIERGAEHACRVHTNEEYLVEPNPNAETVAFVFKTVSEPHIGELSFLRIYSGHIESGHELINAQTGQPEKLGQIYTVVGKERRPVERLLAGDIGVVLKLKDTHTNNTLADRGVDYIISPVSFPEPLTDLAIKPKAKGDEDRISSALYHLHEEDPSFRISRDEEFAQTILSGLGDVHLETIIRRLKEKFGIEVETSPPRVPYRETIRTVAKAQGKYKKQTGGRGHYGDVWLRLEPLPRGAGFQFESEVVGGVVPTRFLPAVQKGIEETMQKGLLAGYPIVDVKAVPYDGSHHPVDSSEYSFKVAASLAFKAAFEKARPTLLEPIYKVMVFTPETFTGEIMGDLSSRRGKILGMESDGLLQRLSALVPLAELYGYQSALNRITQGRARFTREFYGYEEVPAEIAPKLIKAFKPVEAE